MSDDNPFSEAQFKTLKYHPGFPGRFHDITAAIAFCRTFFPWYNTEHRHGGIAMLTRTTCITIEPRACWSSAGGPCKPPGPSSRTLRSRDPTTGSPSPSRLDQPTCDTHNRRNCSVNRNRHCLKVVDRFRGGFVDVSGVARRFDEGLDEHGRCVVALGPVVGQAPAD